MKEGMPMFTDTSTDVRHNWMYWFSYTIIPYDLGHILKN